ncbi:MAG: acyl-CoA dehydrogenase, partial [Mesorhizobium sp.]
HQQQWLSKTRAGKAISAFALSEPRSGSDVANTEMTATRDGDSYVLSGEKTWISNGGIADLYVVFARTGEAPGAKGLSAFLVPGDARGLGAAALGFARRALDESIKRVSERKLFGAPMAELQMVQGHIAEMALDVDAAALLVYRAAWTKDMGAPRVTREAAMAKLFATDKAQEVIDKAVQLHGGDGVRKGHIVESLYREIRALRIYEGASDVQKVVIARQAMGA